MSAQKLIVLITGANGGIGFELASQLMSEASRHVLLGSRSIEKGEAAVKELKSRNKPGSVELLQVDVSDEDSIKRAAQSVEKSHSRLDALVNNAAVAGPPAISGSIGQQMSQCFQTNATGPWLMLEAFAPLLKKSITTPRVCNVTSGVGSIGLRLDPKSATYSIPAVQYRASKSALNMITACQAVEYGKEGFKIFALCPGFAVSNLSENNTIENGAMPTSEAVIPIIKILSGERDNEHGGFLKANGQYPW